jgi:hypothetical protein
MKIEMRDALERPHVLRAFTGLNPEEFEILTKVFAEVWDQQTERNWQGQPRRYAKGGGPRGELDSPELKLFFILMYLRLYPIQEVMGFLFGFNQCQANKWILRLLPALDQALRRFSALPVRQPSALEKLLARCPDHEVRLDGSERPIRRPKDPEKQRLCYSGRKKRHTVKNVLMTLGRTVKFLSPTAPGRQHDKTLAEPLQAVHVPGHRGVITDTGFQALTLQNTPVLHPYKKPRGGELSADRKLFNRMLAKLRVKVEHAIGGIKRLRIVSDIFRNIKAGLDDLVMEVACGLHNFREALRRPDTTNTSMRLCLAELNQE